MLTRAVDVPRGTVFLGGIDLLDLDVEELRRWIAVVPQRTEILAGTLAENVALFDPELLDRAPPGRSTSWAWPAWVAELPDGMDTRLGEGGHVLSAGQEQLVAFARILVRDPHVVILDEATARMDPVTEARVQRATERLLAGPDRHRHRAPALLGAPLRRGGRAGRRRGGRGRAAARVASASPRCWPRSRTARSSRRRRPCSTDDDRAARGPAAEAARAGSAAPRRRRVGPAGADAPRDAKAEPPPLPAPPRPARCARSSGWSRNDPRYGLAARRRCSSC